MTTNIQRYQLQQRKLNGESKKISKQAEKDTTISTQVYVLQIKMYWKQKKPLNHMAFSDITCLIPTTLLKSSSSARIMYL
jgi:hypothetical protein